MKKTMHNAIKVHPLANLVPLAIKADQDALNQDIEENGFQKAAGLIVLWLGVCRIQHHQFAKNTTINKFFINIH